MKLTLIECILQCQSVLGVREIFSTLGSRMLPIIMEMYPRGFPNEVKARGSVGKRNADGFDDLFLLRPASGLNA